MTLEDYITSNLNSITDNLFLSLCTDTTLPLYVIYTPLLTQYTDYLASPDECTTGLFIVDIYSSNFNDALILAAQAKDLLDNRDNSTLSNELDLSGYTGGGNNSIRYRISQQYKFTLS